MATNEVRLPAEHLAACINQHRLPLDLGLHQCIQIPKWLLHINVAALASWVILNGKKEIGNATVGWITNIILFKGWNVIGKWKYQRILL